MMRVFYTSASFSSSYGGPAYSVLHLASSLARAGAETALWAPDGSVTNQSIPEQSVRRFAGSLSEAMAAFGPVDVLHDSGLWLPHNNAVASHAAHFGTPLVISTRGMLSPWALGHKRLKKTIAWHLYQKRNLNRAGLLHVTSLQESDDVVRLGLQPPVRYIPNGVDVPECFGLVRRDGPRRAVFLGRLHPVKGLPMLLEAWATQRLEGWELVLAGPDEDGYQAFLETKISELGLSGTTRLIGPVAGASKDELLRTADLFVLPSHSESFGMAVAEACAFGLPVLTTTAVPWPELEANRCGWRVATNANALSGALRTATALSSGDLRSMGLRARELVEKNFAWTAIAGQFMQIYSELAATRTVRA